MAHPESLFHGRVNRKLPREIHAEKMHNIYRGGTADYWYSGYKADLWVEYKWEPKLPAKVPVNPDFSALQLLWLNDAWKKGRNVIAICGSPQGAAILRNGDWNHPVALNRFTESDDTIAKYIVWRVHATPPRPIVPRIEPNL